MIEAVWTFGSDVLKVMNPIGDIKISLKFTSQNGNLNGKVVEIEVFLLCGLNATLFLFVPTILDTDNFMLGSKTTL